jgi:hypothetical protein
MSSLLLSVSRGLSKQFKSRCLRPGIMSFSTDTASSGGGGGGGREGARRALLDAHAVCFDVDSTVATYEGIDVLAAFKGVGAEVAELTRSAMGGSALFEDTFRDRLHLIQPSAQDIDRCLAAHPFEVSPGVAEVVERLHARGTIVYLVSGGLRQVGTPPVLALDVLQSCWAPMLTDR